MIACSYTPGKAVGAFFVKTGLKRDILCILYDIAAGRFAISRVASVGRALIISIWPGNLGQKGKL